MKNKIETCHQFIVTLLGYANNWPVTESFKLTLHEDYTVPEWFNINRPRVRGNKLNGQVYALLNFWQISVGTVGAKLPEEAYILEKMSNSSTGRTYSSCFDDDEEEPQQERWDAPVGMGGYYQYQPNEERPRPDYKLMYKGEVIGWARRTMKAYRGYVGEDLEHHVVQAEDFHRVLEYLVEQHKAKLRYSKSDNKTIHDIAIGKGFNLKGDYWWRKSKVPSLGGPAHIVELFCGEDQIAEVLATDAEHSAYAGVFMGTTTPVIVDPNYKNVLKFLRKTHKADREFAHVPQERKLGDDYYWTNETTDEEDAEQVYHLRIKGRKTPLGIVERNRSSLSAQSGWNARLLGEDGTTYWQGAGRNHVYALRKVMREHKSMVKKEKQ